MLLALALGCGGARGDTATGRMTVNWRGTENGKARLPATIEWCPVTRMATLRAISNDTGVLVALQERDSLVTGSHQVVSTAIQPQSPLPNATAALRWVLDTTSIEGYAGVSGAVTINATGPTVSGTINIRMRKPASQDTVVLHGKFSGVPVTISAANCVAPK